MNIAPEEIVSQMAKELKEMKAAFGDIRSAFDKHTKAHHRTKLELEEVKAEKDFLQQENQNLEKEVHEARRLVEDKTTEIKTLSETIHALQSSRDQEVKSIKLGLNSNEQITLLKYECELLKAAVRSLECDLNRERSEHGQLKIMYHKLFSEQQQMMSTP